MAYRNIDNNKNFEYEHLQRKEDDEKVVIIAIQYVCVWALTSLNIRQKW